MNKITQLQVQTAGGNTLSFFYNPDNNLLVVDIIHANEKGGRELLRQTLNERQLLAHAEPAIEIKAGCSRTNRKTPAQWCEKFGVEVIDPDGWDRTDPQCMAYPLRQDQFIERYQRSTCRVIDRAKYLPYRHLFG